MPARYRLITLSVVVLSALVLSLAFPGAGLTERGGSAIQAAPGEISIINFAFVPQTAYVEVGTAVRWTNNDTVDHTVTSDSALFNSPTLAPGDQFVYTFTITGTFPYHCSIHTSMHGTVVVFQGPEQVFLPLMLRGAP